MAAFIMGIVVAPIIGPTLGGWITDNYSWRWIFYVNLPIGIMAFFAVRAFVEDPPWVRAARRARIDGIGFALLVVWVGTLQVVLDKGQEVDWFGTAWVRWASAIVVVGLVAFVIRQMTTRDPIVDLRVFGNRNFTTGTLLVTVLGAVLYGSTALLPLLLQTLMGYPALESGLALSPRGIGAFFTTLAIGRIVGLVDGRFLIAIGLAGVAFANELFARLNLQMDIRAIIWPTVLNGAALSFVFVPLTTTTMGTLRNDQIGNATGLYNLMRNLGGSIGISAASTMVARWSQVYQAHMVAHLTPYDAAFRDHVRSLGATLAAQGGGARPGTPAFAAVYGELQRQAAVRAYLDDFRTLAVLSLCCVPLAFLFRRIRPGKGAPPPAAH
jgi:DHA2 family multidrug resistance protein